MLITYFSNYAEMFLQNSIFNLLQISRLCLDFYFWHHLTFAGGTLLQKISSCLEVLDCFMKQPYPIVESMVVADKCAGSGGSDNLTACVASIMGMSSITKYPKYANSSCLNCFVK